jgi:hypothetical protein
MARPEKEVATDTRRGLTRPTHLEMWKSEMADSSGLLGVVNPQPAARLGGHGGMRHDRAYQDGGAAA